MKALFLGASLLLGLTPVFAAGGKIAFRSDRDGNQEIYVMNPDGTGQTNATNTPSVDENVPSWNAEGGKIAYARTDDIWTMNSVGSAQTRIPIGHLATDPDYDPTGQKLAYSRFGGFDNDIYVNTVDGSNEKRIINNPLGDYWPRWSPDGSKISFCTFPNGSTPDVYTANADGTGQVRLTSLGINQRADWSPDSTKLVFESTRDGNPEIYIMNADGSNQTRVTNNAATDTFPVFSPDGTQIAFVSNRDGNNEIYVMNANGSNLTRLTNNSADDFVPSWGVVVAAGSPTINIGDATVTEGNSGTSTLAFTVSLTAASAQTVTVQYQTSNGTATSPSDYTALVPGTLTFASGETSKTVNVTVQSDTLDEADETVNMSLFGASSAFLGDATAVGTILDDDAAPTISIGDVTQVETSSGTSSFAFTASLSAPSGQTITVNYTTADGTATQPSDYTARTGTLSFAPGSINRSIIVPVTGDSAIEPNETFSVTLTAPVNATLADGQGTGTITNDDFPVLSVTGSSVTEGDSGTNSVAFTVTLSQAYPDAVSFDFATAPGTATAGTDYVTTSGSRTILPGETSKAINITVKGDVIDEADETFYLVISNPVNATIASGLPSEPSGHTYELVAASLTWGNARTAAAARSYLGTPGHLATITSATEQSYVANLISGTEAWIGGTQPVGSTEPAGGFTWITGEPFNYTNWRSGEPNNASNEDTILFSYDGSWNDLSATSIVAHYLVEYDTATGSNNPGQGVATIIDNDAPPTLSINDVQVIEGSGGTNDAVFTITVNGPSERAMAVDVSTEDGSALSNADYQNVNRTVIIPAGQPSATVSVPIVTDLVDEDSETFNLNLSGAANATIADGVGQGTITDDDAPPGLRIDDITTAEGNSGTTAANFTVSLSAPSSRTVTVKYATESPSSGAIATPNVDYVALAPTLLTFAPGETSKTATVLIKGDTLLEANERFIGRLSAPTNATIADGGSYATITDDDAVPALRISDVTVAESAASATFTVSLSAISGKTVTVQYATNTPSSVPATAGVDYVAVPATTLTFAPGETTKQVTVQLINDTLDEANERFLVKLSGATNASIADREGFGTITDDDVAPSLRINDVSLAEGNSNTTAFTFTVTLSAPSGNSVSVKYATAASSSQPATAGVDYIAIPLTTLTFLPGETSKQITVLVNGDTQIEGYERFMVKLTAPVSATIADSEGFGTITNDDVAAPIFSEEPSQ